MELMVISGFLGSGKTSLLLRLAKAFAEQGRKVAIIENEVGKTGVDGELLAQEGLDVREIYSGCVCCSLRHDLIHTLLELERGVKPDVVFLEPSGVAGPKQIQHCLHGYGGEINRQLFIVVADAQRLPAIRDFSIPLIQDGLEIADIVAVNKSDLVPAEQLDALAERIRAANPSAEILFVSATGGAGVDRLIGRVESLRPQVHAAVPDVHGTERPEAAIFAGTVAVDLPAGDAPEHVKEMLESLSRKLKASDGILIGHLKAILKTDPIGYYVLSVTSENGVAEGKGRLPAGPVKQLVVTVNAIVYGIDEEPFHLLCQKSFGCLSGLLKRS